MEKNEVKKDSRLEHFKRQNASVLFPVEEGEEFIRFIRSRMRDPVSVQRRGEMEHQIQTDHVQAEMLRHACDVAFLQQKPAQFQFAQLGAEGDPAARTYDVTVSVPKMIAVTPDTYSKEDEHQISSTFRDDQWLDDQR